MVIHPFRFNIYLLLIAAFLGGTGCQSTKSKEENQMATLRIHLETNPLPDYSERIIVLRNAPMHLYVEKSPFLNEAHITSARVVETPDSFALQVKLNQQGQRLLEQYSSANSQRRFAIRCQFRQSTNVFDRWLAAPYIANRITDGTITFTPDADHIEADCIVRGWNNVAGYKPKKDKVKEPKTKFSEAP